MSPRRALSLLLASLAAPLWGLGEPLPEQVKAVELALVTEPARAVELATALVGRAPDSAVAQALLGRAAAQAGRPEDALAPLRRARELGADDLRTQLYLASALWETNRFDEAEVAFRLACAEAGPGREAFVAWHQLGRLLLWLGRGQEAVEPLTRASGLRPGAADVALDLAQALEEGDPERALTAYWRAVELAPESPRARWGLAQRLVRLGRETEAAAELEVFRRIEEREREAVRSEGLARAALARSWAWLQEGRSAEAASAFRELGEGAEALEGLARALAAQGRHGEAVAVLERAVQLHPERPGLVDLLTLERLAASGEEP